MKKLSIIAILAALSSHCLAEDAVCLYTIFHDDNSVGERFRTKMNSMGECFEVISNAKMPMPTRPSGDYEVMGAMWCGGEFERQHDSQWIKDKEVDLSE